ncbi:c-type cytochrome [Thalassotalea ganghwensis]
MTIQQQLKRVLTILGLATPLYLGGFFYALANQTPTNFQSCVACHGDKGQGNESLNAPVLAGQLSQYTTRQLEHFARGIRGAHPDDINGQTMAAMVKTLSVNDYQLIADFLSQQVVDKPNQSISGDMKNGSRYYQAKCGACHGGQAQGNEAFNAPKLAGQQVSYLQRQMQNFTNGVRGTHQDDKFGRQMAMMAKTVSEQELADILFYIVNQ